MDAWSIFVQSLKAIEVPEGGEILNDTKSCGFFSLLVLYTRYIEARITMSQTNYT